MGGRQEGKGKHCTGKEQKGAAAQWWGQPGQDEGLKENLEGETENQE